MSIEVHFFCSQEQWPEQVHMHKFPHVLIRKLEDLYWWRPRALWNGLGCSRWWLSRRHRRKRRNDPASEMLWFKLACRLFLCNSISWTMVAYTAQRHCKLVNFVKFWVTEDSYVNAAFWLQCVFGNEYCDSDSLHIYCSSRQLCLCNPKCEQRDVQDDTWKHDPYTICCCNSHLAWREWCLREGQAIIHASNTDPF